jgi:hypothetical protein
MKRQVQKMSRKFESLCRFVENRCPNPELADRAVELLQGFSDKEDKRWSTLEPLTDSLSEKVALALHEAIGTKMNKIIYVHLSRKPLLSDDWVPNGLVIDSDADSIDFLYYSTFDCQGPFLIDDGKDLSFCCGDDLNEQCRRMSSGEPGEETDEELWYLIARNLGHEDCDAEPTLLYVHLYLAFVIMGCQTSAQSLDKLIEVLPHAVPFGTKRDEPGTWLVLCL